MSNDKKQYYALDDAHEIVSDRKMKKNKSETNILTKEFFSKRRKLTKKRPAKAKA